MARLETVAYTPVVVMMAESKFKPLRKNTSGPEPDQAFLMTSHDPANTSKNFQVAFRLHLPSPLCAPIHSQLPRFITRSTFSICLYVWDNSPPHAGLTLSPVTPRKHAPTQDVNIHTLSSPVITSMSRKVSPFSVIL